MPKTSLTSFARHDLGVQPTQVLLDHIAPDQAGTVAFSKQVFQVLGAQLDWLAVGFQSRIATARGYLAAVVGQFRGVKSAAPKKAFISLSFIPSALFRCSLAWPQACQPPRVFPTSISPVLPILTGLWLDRALHHREHRFGITPPLDPRQGKFLLMWVETWVVKSRQEKTLSKSIT